MPLKTTMAEVNELFGDFGTIKKINLYWVPKMTQSINAKVFYAEKQSCQAAFDTLNQAELDGLTIKIKVN